VSSEASSSEAEDHQKL